MVWGGLCVGYQADTINTTHSSILNIRGTLMLKGNGYHSFAHGLVLSIAKGAIVTLGNNFSCSYNARLTINKSLIVGDDNMWSFDNIIRDTDGHQILDESGNLINPNKGIVFGRHVWLGCRNIVLKGVQVPSNTIIGAGGLITKCLKESNGIYVSNNLIRNNINWSRKFIIDE